jgi:aspartate racemase
MNEYLYKKLGGLNSIEALIYSINFARLEEALNRNDWGEIGRMVAQMAQTIETAGADFLIMTSNAIHKVADQVEAAVAIPLLHIVEPTAYAIQKAGLKKVGLLGTKVTMGEPFYLGRLQKKHGIEILVPDMADQEKIHAIIFTELVQGKVREESKKEYLKIIDKLSKRGAEGIILGCTEINLLIHQKDTPTPLYDTTELHAIAAVEFSL